MLRCWQGCLRTSSASPTPLRTSPASGMRRRRQQRVGCANSPTGTAGMCPQCAQSPRGAMAPVGRGTSASSPARTCSSSPSSTSVSWTPPQTRPSTGGRSAWTRWVSSTPRGTSQPTGLGLRGSSTCHGSHRSPTTQTSSSTRCGAALPAPQRCPAAPRWTPAGSTWQTPPPTQKSAPTHPWLGQPQPPQEWGSLSPLLQGLIQANTWVVLQDLQPGVRYHIQVRSKPDGTSMDGVWGPWSQAVAAETPRSSGDIGLCCSTPDLQHVRCKWIWDPTEPHSSHQLFYRPPLSGAGTREDAWQQCEEVSVGAQGTHTCTFQPRAGSAISVLVNITRPHALPTLSYFKESFWLHQAVLTDAPQLVQAMVSQGQLSLEWLPPLEALAEQLDYQVRYAVENSHDWKVLQVPQASRKEVLDLRPGARYHAQVRAQPSGPWYRGSWSAWSEPVMVDITDDAGKGQGRSKGCSQRSHTAEGWIIPSVTVVPLLFTGVLLGLRCTFPSLYSNVKQKLWPPVPDLHRALGSFLHESSKHGQVRGPGLGPPLPSLSRRQLQGQPPPRPLCHPLGQQLLQAAAGGGGRPALPAGGAARPAGGGGPAAPAAGASCRPAVRHRHRQPVLPAHERLGPARAALSRSPSPPCPEINETRNHPASPLLRGVPVPVPQRSRAAMPTPPR
ncbi:thrombopoietin receptor isoform X9 [Larus michahellis]|uniref:thrombopoietin receptor isoform X9 n=1 Tax=Larus michahellis TaxID=119627 RepID=UPI003D9B2EC6